MENYKYQLSINTRNSMVNFRTEVEAEFLGILFDYKKQQPATITEVIARLKELEGEIVKVEVKPQMSQAQPPINPPYTPTHFPSGAPTGRDKPLDDEPLHSRPSEPPVNLGCQHEHREKITGENRFGVWTGEKCTDCKDARFWNKKKDGSGYWSPWEAPKRKR